MSNNSLFIENKPTKEYLEEIFASIQATGEPGFVNVAESKRRRPDYAGTNPCGEILLPANAVCNLTTINLTAFVLTGKRGEAAVDWVGLKQAMYLSARAGYRMTCVDLELPGWNHIHHRDRLLGCSMTGYQDMIGMLGEGFNQKLLLQEMRKWTHQYADDYAEELGTPKPLLVTSVKPEGCTTVEMMRTLDEGVLFLEEISPGISSDDTPNGFHELPLSYESEGNKVKKIYKNDIKNVKRITLKNGRVLRITDEHPMSVGGEWVAGKDLEVGQVLDYKLGTYLNSRNYPLVDIDYSLYRSDAKLEKYPKEMNEDLAWLLGAYFANGCFTTYERIKFHCQYKEVHEKVQRIWKEQFGIETKIVRSTDRDSYTQDFRRIAIRQWLDSNGIKKYNEEGEMVIPEVVRRSSRACILAFIAGYADNDGCFENKSFSIDSSKEEFIRHLQQVGEAVGLCFGVSKNASRANSFSKKPMWKVHLSRAFSDEGSIEYLNSVSVKAELQGFIELGIVRSKNPYTIVKIEDEGDEQTYDIEVDTTHCYYQGGLLSHNTLSLLAGGVSPGVHYQHSPYFIRRIRVNASDPLAKTALELGWRINPEVGQTMENATTLVIDFPCKSTSRKTKKDVTAIEQLETYLMFQKNYTEHNSSNTISVKPDEWKGVTDFVYSHWDDILGVTFLETNPTYYPLMPYEECTKEEYEELLKITKPFDPEILNNMEITTRNLGKEFEILDDKEGCENGVCPIR